MRCTAGRFVVALLTPVVLGGGSRLAAQAPTQGWLHVVWDGVATQDDPDGARFFLVDNAGRSTAVHPPRTERERLFALDRQRVELRVAPFALQPIGPIVPAARGRSVVEPAAFITLLCRFADDPSTPFDTAAVARVLGPTYPGMAHYYAELSRDGAVMAGNRPSPRWYTLPQPRAFYVSGTSTNFHALAQDCTGAADAEVDFAPFVGINLQFNGALSIRSTPPYDTLSFGGGWTVNIDGQLRQVGMTWLSRLHYSNYVVVPHEMGHALGWPHSSGNYGQEYDSRWDLMSAGYLRYVAAYGWTSIHTITPHKYARGWIADSRLWEPALNAQETRLIVRSALPPDSGALMAKVDLPDGTWYSVETRRLAGYDDPLPGEAVVIHRVYGVRAYVIDPDFNGNPNDAAAMWLPGETFTDDDHRVAVRVESATPAGFWVSITRGTVPLVITSDTTRPAGTMGVTYSDLLRADGGWGPQAWSLVGGALPPGVSLAGANGLIAGVPADHGTFRFTMRVASGGETQERSFVVFIDRPSLQVQDVVDQLLGSQSLTLDLQRYLDQEGNQNGVFDIGDVRAWLIASGQLPGALRVSKR